MNHTHQRISLIFLMLLAAVLPAAASHPLNIPGAATTRVGIYIEDLGTGRVIAECNANDTFIPASIMKSVTSATVLTDVAPDGCFSTPVDAVGRFTGNILDGNLVVRTMGDPTIESRHFESYLGFADSIAAATRRCGISIITGDVVIDESAFTDATVPHGWLDTDLNEWYGAYPRGANFRGNLSGKRPVKNPASEMRRAVVQALNSRGVEVRQMAVKPDISKVKNIYVHTSPRLDEILKSLMFRSDNMLAESMLRILEPGGTRAASLDYEKRFWRMKGVDLSGIEIVDGSGLSRADKVSPRFMADMLRWMYRSPNRVAYASLFPRAGQDGTMRNFLKDTRLDGRLAMKTGSMNGVQSYAGYLIDYYGNPTHLVVVIVNEFSCDRGVLRKRIADFLLDKLP